MEPNYLDKQSFISLGWPELIDLLIRETTLPMTAEHCRVLPFLETPEEVCERLATVWEGVLLGREGKGLPLSPSADPRPILARAAKGAALEGVELRIVHDLLAQAESVHSFLIRRKERSPRLFQRAIGIEPLERLKTKIAATVDPEGRILEGATPALRALTAEANRAREEMTERLDRMIRSPRYEPLLQEAYYTEREGRYVLPFKASDQYKEGGVVHDLSASGATAFVEPKELVGPNNRLRVARLEVAREVERILKSLSEEVARETGRLDRNIEILVELDQIEASARLTRRIDGNCPRVTGGGALRLLEARHPLLLVRKGTVVPNDIVLEEGALALILSGPNTGGKTVLLKTIGLLALMVRAGLPIPCREASEIPLFPEVLVDIGDDQDLSRDLSSFSGHLLKILAILDAGPPGSLVLLDELATSTDPAEGAALAAAILTELVDRGMRVVTTTHYPMLKELAQIDFRFVNGSLAFDIDRLAPTYRLIPGIPGRSAALEIASRLGLSKSILSRARERLKPLEETTERLIAQLEQEREKAESERREWERLRAEAEEAAAVQKEGAARWAMSEKEIRKEVRRKVADAVAEARSEIAALTAEMKTRPDPVLIKKGKERLVEIERRATGEVVPKTDIRLEVGKPVEIIPLGKKGTLLDPPEGAKKVRVQIGEQIVFVSPDLLEGSPEIPSEEETSGPPTRSSIDSGNSMAALDLIGKRVDEALELLERFLDRAMLEGVSDVRLVHGHGSGKLKKAIRSHLSSSPYVACFRPGDLIEGGDAVTIVTIEEG